MHSWFVGNRDIEGFFNQKIFNVFGFRAATLKHNARDDPDQFLLCWHMLREGS